MKKNGNNNKFFSIDEDLPLPNPVFKNGKYLTTNKTNIKKNNKNIYEIVLIPEIRLNAKFIIKIENNNLNILK